MRPCFNSAENGNKSKKIPLQALLRASLPALMIAVSLGLSGCSWTFPGLKSEAVNRKVLEDDITTGSIKPNGEPQKPIIQLKELTEEDWRRAKAALAVAVDPHGSTDRVLWDNPKTLAKGSFAPDGPPFVKNDEVCRNFKTMVTDQEKTQNLIGTACRPSGGEWDVTDIKDAPKAKAADSKAKTLQGKDKVGADVTSARNLLAVPSTPRKVAKATP